MSQKQILVLGGGFSGLWSAVGAARKLDQMGLGPKDVTITLVNQDAYHSIRVRNYEADLSAVRVSLDDVLEPVGVRRIEGEVVDLDLPRKSVRVRAAASDGLATLTYDRLGFALGSRLRRPNIPGLSKHSFDVDTYTGAARLNAHLNSLPTQPDSPGRNTALVVGAGLTGVEAATEMPEKLRAVLADGQRTKAFRVILADHSPQVGSDMGNSARPVIEQALRELGVETRTEASVSAIDEFGVTLATGANQQQPASSKMLCPGWCIRARLQSCRSEAKIWTALAAGSPQGLKPNSSRGLLRHD